MLQKKDEAEAGAAPEESADAPRHGRVGLRRQALIAIAILAAGGLVALVMILSREAPPERPPRETVPLVQTMKVELQTGSLTITGSGTVRAQEEVELAPEIGGEVVYVAPSLTEGGVVRQGQVLVRIDPADFRNAVQSAQAEVAQQRVALLEAREEAELAREEYRRFEEREARRGAAPFSSVDDDDYAARILPPGRLREGPGRAGGREAGQPGPLTLRRPQLQAAAAALRRAQAQLADARLALSRTTIRAPFTGLVRSESVARGSYLAPGQSFAQIVASDAFEVVVPLTSSEAALIPSLFGDRRTQATVLADYGGRRYRWNAFVARADRVLDPETRTIDVILRVPAPLRGGAIAPDDLSDAAGTDARRVVAPPLLVGDFVTARIEGERVEGFFTIPASALRKDDRIWIVRDGRLAIEPVDVLQAVDDAVIVRSDAVREGDRVVVSNLGVATEGMRLRTSDSAAPAARPGGG